MRTSIVIISLVTFLFALVLIPSQAQSSFLGRTRAAFDNKWYQVRQDAPDPEGAADLLSKIRSRLIHLASIIPGHRGLQLRLQKTEFVENTLRLPPRRFTSFTVNKGEQVVLCLRDPRTQTFHDIDLLTYVAIHETAHIACPEIGHTPRFREIFQELLKAALDSGVLKRTDYRTEPMQYCGITISERVV